MPVAAADVVLDGWSSGRCSLCVWAVERVFEITEPSGFGGWCCSLPTGLSPVYQLLGIAP